MIAPATVVIMEPLSVDLRSRVPSYVQLADALRERITAGQIATGDLLPSITRIQQETGLSPNTIRRGIRLLIDEGLAVVAPGRGTYAV